jgi:hypothetical protein
MGQMKKPGTQGREHSRTKQNGTGPAAKKSPGRGNAGAARKASIARHAAAGETPEGFPLTKAANGSKRAVGGRKAKA